MKEEQADFTAALSQNADKLLSRGREEFNTILKLHDITPEALDDMVRSIRDWLSKQPHLPGDKLRDQQIHGLFLFRCFSIEKVKKCIDMYFTARLRIPEILRDRDPLDPKISFYLKQGYWACMPKLTPEGYRVIIMRTIPIDNLEVTLICKVGMMMAEYRYFNETSIGDECVIDLEYLTLQDSMQMTPVLIARIVNFVSVAFAARLKMVRILNLPPFAGAVLNLFKKFMKPKLADRILLSTREEVLKALPKECLPEEYDGEGGRIEDIADEWCKTLQSDSWRQFFLEQNNVFSDESKRLIKSSDDELFGTDGSFRTLTID